METKKINSSYIFRVVCVLLMCLGCQNVSNYEKEGQAINIQEKCIQIANEKFKSEGYKIEKYDIRFEEIKKGYKIVYMPKGLCLGDGGEVLINKKNFTVKDVIFYQ